MAATAMMGLTVLSDEAAAEIGQRLWEALRQAQLRGEPVSREALHFAAQLNDVDARPRSWMGLKQASTYSGVPIRTLYDWRSRGILSSSKVGGRVRVDRHELDDVVSARSGESRQNPADPVDSRVSDGDDYPHE